MKKPLILFVLPLIIMMTSCDEAITADIVTTMFPQYDIARAIVGDRLRVHSILPYGVEVHDFEATSRDIVTMKNAKLVLYTSPLIDPWMNETTIKDEDTDVIDLSTAYESEQPYLTTSSVHPDDNIHYWVDPLIIVELVTVIKNRIVAIDPSNEDYYTANAAEYIQDIMTTYESFISYLTDHDDLNRTLYFAGHNAFGLFSGRHQLDIHGLFANFQPDEDLGSRQLMDFTSEVKAANTHYLLIEEMVSPRAAMTIQTELARQDYALTLLELHAYHNLSQTDANANLTYHDLYERNIAHIEQVLREV